MRQMFSASLVLALFACGSPSEEPRIDVVDDALAGESDARIIRPGTTWGGEHVGLTVAKDGGALEYDCAIGTIDSPINLDRSGRFDVNGTHTIGHGGPSRPGDPADKHPAHYTGQVVAKTMTLNVELTDLKTKLGPYTLTLAASPHVFKCL